MSIPHQTGYAPPHGYPQQNGYGGYGGYPPPGGYGGPPASNGMAIAALVLGILGLVGGLVPFLGWFASPLALAGVGFGIAGLSRAKTVGQGKGMAIAGLVTGTIGVLAIVAWTVLIVLSAEQTADIYSGEALFGCDTTEDVYQDSVEEFRAAEGREPNSDAEMVAEGHLGWTSGDWDVEIIDGRAEVVKQPGGEC